MIAILVSFDPFVNPYHSARSLSYAAKGMVATSQALAAQAGLDILKRGGNAVDAAVATAACLTVVEPTSNGIGGDAFTIVWIKNKMYGLNSSGPAPADISIEKVKKSGFDKMPLTGWTPVTVPGAPGAWAALIKRFGNLSLSECLQAAISYAREGYPVSPVVGQAWKNAHKLYQGEEFKAWYDTFTDNGRAPEIGELWKLPDHANTLEEIGLSNAENFYTGRLAQAIAETSASQGGYMKLSDLAGFSPQWVEPISVNYRGYDVWELPPNGQGIVALIALNILKGYENPTHHQQFEAIKLAFSAGRQLVTDSHQLKQDPLDFLSEDYAAQLRSRITDIAAEPLAPLPYKGGTVYLATADGEGNMVSYIQSNYMGFGSGIVIPGTGIAMQNRGCDFSLDPEHVNCLAGGKRCYHTIIPGFLSKNGLPIGPFGVMGGYMQPQGHVQVITNTIDRHLNPQAALDCPRWQWLEGKKFIIEQDFPRHIALQLAERGHDIQPSLNTGLFGRGQIIWRGNDVLIGGTESRADSIIAGW